MALAGKGIVAIWNDITPEGRAEFYEWHNREHMPERLAIPGFLRGRRYIAVQGVPEYFTLYEATSLDVLAGPDYLARLNAPTPWTLKVVGPHFRNMSRGVCNVAFSAAIGDGGYLATLQFKPGQGSDDRLRSMLIGNLLPPVLGQPTVAGVHLCTADPEVSSVTTAEKKGQAVAIPNWLIMIESAMARELPTIIAALQDSISPHIDADTVNSGIYQFEYSPAAADK